MMKNTLLLFSFFTCLTVSAQEVISTQGDSYSNGSGNIDFTIGEVVINTGTDGTNDITQGFHQTKWNIVGLEDHATNYDATVFPNPAEDILNIKASAFKKVVYTVYDAQGKLVLQGNLQARQTPVKVGRLASGTYSLALRNETQNLKTFKLIKIQ